ncbi:hypothetical protein CKO15_06785 [Halorhodospira abdelmalekii]|uniref:nitrogenase-stabilizing/protective protein NifW n=1 Tax=Halorhodospira abdelmalekii TaxID=421629 RepID=UPI00190429A6|nr:nitrogenase-stabilizing/protective protein NifW [Halorhodospira abdelmalekii]MBK1734993.1 hypothetical protein [Halorhodospira abdelmalekii]
MWQEILEQAVPDLSSAEAFLEGLEVPYDPALVRVYRLHILRRFHDYLGEVAPAAEPEAALRQAADLLQRAHDDFIGSDARTEKALGVYQRSGAADRHTVATIPLDQIRRQ